MLINYLLITNKQNAVSPEEQESKEKKTFKKMVNNLINVMKMTSSHRITPTEDLRDSDVEVVLGPKLAYFM